MGFTWDKKPCRLQGINQTTAMPASTRSLSKEIRQGHAMAAMCLLPSNSFELPVHPEMKQLIEEFSYLFQEPKQLPLARAIDHHINLKDGIDPANVRPYRYAHFQKAKIERQVQDMLQLGLMRSSNSPFSSPALLVKKNDGT